MSGAEMQREKEKVAAKMREKQAAGTDVQIVFSLSSRRTLLMSFSFSADAKKLAEGAGGVKKK